MTLDEKIVLEMIEIQKSTKLDFFLSMDSNTFTLRNVTITKSATPVNQPTSRGGVYFSDRFVFKIKAQVTDFSLIPLLSKSMLGPNSDFQDIEITTHAEIEKSMKKITFIAHLTNSMKSSDYIELNMTIIKITYE